MLFGVSSVGLGHIRRSITIAKSLRKMGNFDIEWVSSEPVTTFLSQCGERVIPISRELSSLSSAMEEEVMAGRLGDMSRVARESSKIASRNYLVLKEYLNGYEALVQDEFAETMFCFMWDKKSTLPSKRAVITDYFRFESRSHSPVSRIVLWYANRMLAKSFENTSLRIFADDLDSIPARFRALAKSQFEVVGPVVGDIPRDSRQNLRNRYFPHLRRDKIVLVTIGGTSAGKQLLDFVFSNSREISSALNASIALLLGPRIDRSAYSLNSEDLELVPFTSGILDLFKLADCVVTQGGASTLNEVAAIGTPCVAIPIANHWEQESNARRFHQKFGFEIINHNTLTVNSFVSAVRAALNSTYEPADFHQGVEKSTNLIFNLMRGE